MVNPLHTARVSHKRILWYYTVDNFNLEIILLIWVKRMYPFWKKSHFSFLKTLFSTKLQFFLSIAAIFISKKKNCVFVFVVDQTQNFEDLWGTKQEDSKMHMYFFIFWLVSINVRYCGITEFSRYLAL